MHSSQSGLGSHKYDKEVEAVHARRLDRPIDTEGKESAIGDVVLLCNFCDSCRRACSAKSS
jgi:hypothetical protein